jgi:hypothetical protein
MERLDASVRSPNRALSAHAAPPQLRDGDVAAAPGKMDFGAGGGGDSARSEDPLRYRGRCHLKQLRGSKTPAPERPYRAITLMTRWHSSLRSSCAPSMRPEQIRNLSSRSRLGATEAVCTQRFDVSDDVIGPGQIALNTGAQQQPMPPEDRG